MPDLVSLTLATREVLVIVGLRLVLPEGWTSDTARLDRAGFPEDYRAYRSKPEIVRVRAAGARFGCVLADAGYGFERTIPPGSEQTRPDLGQGHPLLAELSIR